MSLRIESYRGTRKKEGTTEFCYSRVHLRLHNGQKFRIEHRVYGGWGRIMRGGICLRGVFVFVYVLAHERTDYVNTVDYVVSYAASSTVIACHCALSLSSLTIRLATPATRDTTS